jgi:hypothetical protein
MFARVGSGGLIALTLVTGSLAAQTRQVAGTVVSAQSKRPIAEASVVLPGTGGARTNSDGRFTIAVPAGDVRLTVRAIGFVRKEVVVRAGETTVSVELGEDVFRLEEMSSFARRGPAVFVR